MDICIPSWQHKFHVLTEVLSVAYVPWLWMAANKLPEPHKTRIKLLAIAVILVDGGLLLRWLQLKFKKS